MLKQKAIPLNFERIFFFFIFSSSHKRLFSFRVWGNPQRRRNREKASAAAFSISRNVDTLIQEPRTSTLQLYLHPNNDELKLVSMYGGECGSDAGQSVLLSIAKDLNNV